MKTYLHRSIKIPKFLTPTRTRKCLSKYFSFFNNTPPANWVLHTMRDFLLRYSCSYYSSMQQNVTRYFFTCYPCSYYYFMLQKYTVAHSSLEISNKFRENSSERLWMSLHGNILLCGKPFFKWMDLRFILV